MRARNFLDAYCKLKELMRADACWLLEGNEGAAKEAQEEKENEKKRE